MGSERAERRRKRKQARWSNRDDDLDLDGSRSTDVSPAQDRPSNTDTKRPSVRSLLGFLGTRGLVLAIVVVSIVLLASVTTAIVLAYRSSDDFLASRIVGKWERSGPVTFQNPTNVGPPTVTFENVIAHVEFLDNGDLLIRVSPSRVGGFPVPDLPDIRGTWRVDDGCLRLRIGQVHDWQVTYLVTLLESFLETRVVQEEFVFPIRSVDDEQLVFENGLTFQGLGI
jgi:hypothetical protein